ncbi:MAG: twin-arginine translocase TatA/TatE family subunit [Candidatus Dormibacteraeota bacterium]|nr:twin-arginine translocase TatA/TatE family subunit [Candidatus Dormibacteraeota bacterium]
MTGILDHWYILVILLVIVLIIWGPGKLPDVGAGMGRAIREFRKASTETQDAFKSAASGSAPQQQAPAQQPQTQQPAALNAPGATDKDANEPSQQTPVSR